MVRPSPVGIAYQAIHPRHVVIDEQTALGGQVCFVQELVGTGVSSYGKTLDFKREFERTEHKRIVVDDENDLLCDRRGMGFFHEVVRSPPFSGPEPKKPTGTITSTLTLKGVLRRPRQNNAVYGVRDACRWHACC